MKNRVLLENYYLPGDLEQQIEAFVEYYNTERLHSAIGYVTPQEAEEAFYANLNNLDKVA